MLNGLIVRHFPLPNSHSIVKESGSFVLETCQRTLVVSFGSNLGRVDGADTYVGSDAYSLLLEVICGLKSSIIAETEIVQQFKKTYREYISRPDRNSHLMKILERVFKDSKKVRANHLLAVGGRSYASICKKIVKQKSNAKRILIVGSGALAKDIVKLCSKEYELHISARNEGTVKEIVEVSSVEVVPWGKQTDWDQFKCVINTIGAKKILFDSDFFDRWITKHNKNAVFVDLGSPSTIDTSFGENENIFRLTDVLSSAKECERHNQKFVSNALSEISNLSVYRMEYFQSIERRSALSALGEFQCQSIK